MRLQTAQLLRFVRSEVNHLLVLDAVSLSYREPNAHRVLGRLASGEHDAFDAMKYRGALGKLVVKGVLQIERA